MYLSNGVLMREMVQVQRPAVEATRVTLADGGGIHLESTDFWACEFAHAIMHFPYGPPIRHVRFPYGHPVRHMAIRTRACRYVFSSD